MNESTPGKGRDAADPAPAALEQAAERFLLLARATRDAIYDLDFTTGKVWRNDAYQQIYGPEPVGDTKDWWVGCVHPDDREAVMKSFDAAVARGDETWICEYRFRRADGRYAHVADRAFLCHDEAGRTIRMLGAMTDLSDLVHVERELRASEERFRAAAEGGLDSFLLMRPIRNVLGRIVDFAIVYANRNAERLLGRTRETLVGSGLRQLFPGPMLDAFVPRFAAVADGGAPFEEEFAVDDPSIRAKWLRHQVTPAADGIAVTTRDVTDTHVATAELRERDQQLRLALSAAPLGIWSYEPSTDRVTWSDRTADETGALDPMFVGTIDEALSRFVDEDRAVVARAIRRALECGEPEPRIALDVRVLGKDGQPRWRQVKGRAICDTKNKPIRIVGTSMDVDESRRLQAQLLHAQKMESLGRLAGGIAHDFNNLLTVILGEVELATDGPLAPEFHTSFENIRLAAERASSLTRQLLVLARKQVLRFTVEDLNDLVLGADRMLRRVLGERVRVVTQLSGEVGRVRVDKAQIEQVLLNLAINARDAMPNGGTLTLQTKVADAGDRTCIVVKDTGIGMDEATRRRAFDPFFTTKAEGTGLGLSTSYGILRQHGGDLTLHSEPGHGTEVVLALPRALEEAVEPEAPPTTKRPRGSETILLVEDEAQVAEVAVRALRGAGYHVLEAATVDDALALETRTTAPIHLLVTDVVLPQSSGPELAAQLLQRRPQLKILFVSGYNEVLALDAAGRPAVGRFLQKPFSVATLAATVRTILDDRNA
jgi:two-component system cell cycle sensor histidine kinase/response regulator CckA